MWRLKIGMILALILGTVCATPVLAEGTEISVSINSFPVMYTSQTGYPFVDEAGYTQVPLRETMEKFGCLVKWNDKAKVATVISGDKVLRVPIGKNYIIDNGKKKENHTSAMLEEGRVYLPIRIVLESFGATVIWEEDSQTVAVTRGPRDTAVINASDGITQNEILTILDLERKIIDGLNTASNSLKTQNFEAIRNEIAKVSQCCNELVEFCGLFAEFEPVMDSMNLMAQTMEELDQLQIDSAKKFLIATEKMKDIIEASEDLTGIIKNNM
ncbi:MAG: hypothetical protein KHZ62_08850 [Clostridiales bacterium]|nr:hypothetical protein [Clostridiales bacterium]